MEDDKQHETLSVAPDGDGKAAPAREPDAVPISESELARATDKPIQHVPDSSYQNYLFGGVGADERPAWSDSIKGRAAIRLISRGVVGAGFFALGSRMARMQMRGYDEVNFKFDPEKPLQLIAKGIDMTFGKVIKSSVAGAARLGGKTAAEAEALGKSAVTFRDSRVFDPAHPDTMGRSYGADITAFTFDFAMASVGDASTRNIIQALDPNIRKSWLVNDRGETASHDEKKHFDAGKALKAVGRASWRVFSKNQMEDWAAAIPYAYQMKWQRKAINKMFNKRFEGHDLVFDQGWNGGAYKMNQAGQIVGDYQLAGAIDLHARFVGYNWYTLMFREGYDKIGHAISDWKKDHFALHAPQLPADFNPITSPVKAVVDSARYVTKSFIKANLYMNPAVVPFWLMRVSQSKWRGENFIQQQGDSVALGAPTNIFKSPRRVTGDMFKLYPYAASNYDHYPTATLADRMEKRFSQGMNWMGRWQDHLGAKAGKMVNRLGERGVLPRSEWLDKLMTFERRPLNEPLQYGTYETNKLLKNGRKNLTHEWLDASFSYTPYMFAKAELGLLVDDRKGDGKLGQMDTAIYRFMDNVGHLNLPATVRSVKEIWQLGTHFEREMVVREGGNSGVKQSGPTALPANTIDAGSAQYTPANLSRADGDVSEDKRWVQSVLNRQVNPAQIHTASTTRH